MLSPAPAPDRKAQKATLKRTSMMVQQYSQEILSEPRAQSPEELAELGRRAAAALTDSKAYRVGSKVRQEAQKVTSRVPTRRINEVNGAVRVLFGDKFVDWPYAVVAHTDGYLHGVNAAFRDALGYDTKELAQMSFLDLVRPEDREKALRALDRLSSDEAMHEFGSLCRTRKGDYLALEWCAQARGTFIYALAKPA